MQPVSLPVTPLGSSGLAQIDSPEGAVREFQALLITQLLKIARESGKLYESGDAMTGGDGYLEIAEQQLARVLAESDFLGLSRLILDSLTDRQPGADGVPATEASGSRP